MSDAIVLPKPKRLKDIEGLVFGRLLVVRYAGQVTNGKRKLSSWLCLCDCGNEKIARATDLQTGSLSSCGCLRKEALLAVHTKHGMSGLGEYSIWMGMKARCLRTSGISYQNYGARKIMVCERWTTFENFYADMGPRPTNEHSLDRINNDGNYEPGNVRWATVKEQQRNKRSNRVVEFQGERRTVAEWAEIAGLPKAIVYGRLNAGWSIGDALARPIRKVSKPKAPYQEHT